MAGADTLMKMMATYKLIGDQKENLKKGKDKVAGVLGMGGATARADRLRGKIKKKADDKQRKEDKIAATARDEAFLRMHNDGWQAVHDAMRGVKEGATEKEESDATDTNDKMVSDAEKSKKKKKTGGRQKGTPNKAKMDAGGDGSPTATEEGSDPISGVINGDSMSVTSPILQELLEIETKELELDERREDREIKEARRALEDRRDKKGGALLGKKGSPSLLKKEGKGFMSMLASVLAGPFGRIAVGIASVATGLTLLKTILNKIPGVNMKIDPKDAEKLKVKQAEKARLKAAAIEAEKIKAAKLEAEAKAKAAKLEKARLEQEAKARRVTANKIEAERLRVAAKVKLDAEIKAKAVKLEAEAKAKLAAQAEAEAKVKKATAAKLEAERVKVEKLRIAEAEAKKKAIKIAEAEAKAKAATVRAAKLEAEAKAKALKIAEAETKAKAKLQAQAAAQAKADAKALRLQEAEIKRKLALEKAAKAELKLKADAAAQAKLDAKNAKVLADQKAKLKLDSQNAKPKLNSLNQKVPGASQLKLSDTAKQLATKGATPVSAAVTSGAPVRSMLPSLKGTRLDGIVRNSTIGKGVGDVTSKAVTKLAGATPEIIKTTTSTALKGAATVASKLAVPLTIIATAYEGFKTEDDDTLNRDEKNAKHVGTAGAVSMALAGAAVGSVVPVVGTLLGGLAGGAIGYFMGKYGGEKLGEELFLDGKEIGDPTLEKSASEGGKGGETKAEMDMVLAKQAQNSGAVDIGWGDADIDDLEKLKDLTTEQVQALLDVETWSKADEEMLKKVLDAKKNGLTITHDDGGWLGKESLEFGKPGSASVNKEDKENFKGLPLTDLDKITADKKLQDESAAAGLNPGSLYTHDTHLEKILNGEGDKDSIFNGKKGTSFTVQKVTSPSMKPGAPGEAKDLKGADTSINAQQLESALVTEGMRGDKNANRAANNTNVVNQPNNSVSNTNIHQAGSTAHAPQTPAGIGHMGVGSRG